MLGWRYNRKGGDTMPERLKVIIRPDTVVKPDANLQDPTVKKALIEHTALVDKIMGSGQQPPKKNPGKEK